MRALSNRLGVYIACGAVGVPRRGPVPLLSTRGSGSWRWAALVGDEEVFPRLVQEC